MSATAKLTAMVAYVSADKDGAVLMLLVGESKVKLAIDAKDAATWLTFAGRNVSIGLSADLATATQEELKPAAKKKEPKKKKHDGKPHRFMMKHCIDCGEPEPMTCERGFHLVENGVCSRCQMTEAQREEQSKALQAEEAAYVEAVRAAGGAK